MQSKVNKFTNIKERIMYFVENQNIKKSDFFNKIGVTSANFRGLAQKTPINSNAIENIITNYPEINLHWLITGKGAMLQTKIDYIAPMSNKVAEPIISYPESDVVAELKKTINLLNEEKAVLYRLLEANMGKKKT
jgi:hypothetical protein